ncbi:MAG: SDR family oxidoreductase [SAR202 cluster bacterium]|nr:SDR family oxidoreductase [SAR202 cluster bacterium]
MDLGISGKVALVTGGSRGLGRQCALSLAGEGVKVAICGRTRETLDKTVAELKAKGVEAIGVQADISSEADAAPLHDAVVSRLGPIDILVNNVGGSKNRSDIAGTSLGDLKATFDLNVYGGYELMRLVIPHMKSQKWGRIINISSIWGREHGGNVGYMSAKAAVIAMTKHAGLSLAKDGITVNTIAPGSIDFPGGGWERYRKSNPPEVVQDFVKTNLPMGRFGWPEPVGDMTAFLASTRADLITGACIPVDGGQGHTMI